MKKFAVIFLSILFVIALTTTAFGETIKLPKINGQICGYTISSNGTPMDGGCTYVQKMSKKRVKLLKKNINDQRRAKGKNLELNLDLWTEQECEVIQVSGKFTTGEEAIAAVTSSSKDGFGGIDGFNESARKSAVIDTILVFPSGIKMGIGHCDETFGLIRYLSQAEAASVMRNGAKEAQARADREAAEEAAANQPPYEPSIEEVTAAGGIVVTSSF